MINTSELRVGNYIYYRGGYAYRIVKVSDILGERGVNFIGNEYLPFDARNWIVEPIPLTSEILKGCGFEQAGDLFFDKAENGFSYIKKDAYDCNGNFGYCLDDERVIFLELNSLHQLQNLYFALTGRELEVKL